VTQFNPDVYNISYIQSNPQIDLPVNYVPLTIVMLADFFIVLKPG